MFPKLSYLIEYLFGIETDIGVYTFGFFVALAFILAYVVFYSEFKRKEKIGVLKPFKINNSDSRLGVLKGYLSFGIFGFLLGFKIFGGFVQGIGSLHPLHFFFSQQGSLPLGILCLVVFLMLHYYKEKEVRKLPKREFMHPYELMPHLLFWAAIWGFLGAVLFSVFENFSVLVHAESIKGVIMKSGLTFYGGLVFGGISYMIIGYRRGMKVLDLADIGSPGMLMAYGIGRIGCQLSGDGDWGIVNSSTLPPPLGFLPDWMWSFTYPHNVLGQGVPIPGCLGEYCMVLPRGVYPTSFYESVVILIAFSLLWMFRNRIRITGMMFCIYLVVSGGERFLIEFIRLNYKYHIFGIALSQAQLISLLMMVSGAVGGLLLLKKKVRIL